MTNWLPNPFEFATILGGYQTWRARSSYLEVDASTKILRTVLELFDGLKPP